VPFFQIFTRCYPILNEIYSLFYMKMKTKGKSVKIINDDLLIYLDEITLAYWTIKNESPSGKMGFIYILKVLILKIVIN
jgi:hypothetical protein